MYLRIWSGWHGSIVAKVDNVLKDRRTCIDWIFTFNSTRWRFNVGLIYYWLFETYENIRIMWRGKNVTLEKDATEKRKLHKRFLDKIFFCENYVHISWENYTNVSRANYINIFLKNVPRFFFKTHLNIFVKSARKTKKNTRQFRNPIKILTKGKMRQLH